MSGETFIINQQLDSKCYQPLVCPTINGFLVAWGSFDQDKNLDQIKIQSFKRCKPYFHSVLTNITASQRLLFLRQYQYGTYILAVEDETENRVGVEATN